MTDKPENAPSEAEQASLEARRLRGTRKPFGSLEQKLAYPKRVGYHRHWFNDSPGRIQSALEAGYTHVKSQNGKPEKRVVGVAREGGPLNAYLMEIPTELWQEDIERHLERANRAEESIRRSLPQEGTTAPDGTPSASQPADRHKFYQPTSRGTFIKQETR